MVDFTDFITYFSNMPYMCPLFARLLDSKVEKNTMVRVFCHYLLNKNQFRWSESGNYPANKLSPWKSFILWVCGAL